MFPLSHPSQISPPDLTRQEVSLSVSACSLMSLRSDRSLLPHIQSHQVHMTAQLPSSFFLFFSTDDNSSFGGRGILLRAPHLFHYTWFKNIGFLLKLSGWQLFCNYWPLLANADMRVTQKLNSPTPALFPLLFRNCAAVPVQGDRRRRPSVAPLLGECLPGPWGCCRVLTVNGISQ